MEEINYSYEFRVSVLKLIDVLFQKEYFGFLETSIDYALKLYDFIEENIDGGSVKLTPNELVHLGKYYLKYSPNKRTSWYILFYQKEDKFLVNYILNNHTQEAKYFNI